MQIYVKHFNKNISQDTIINLFGRYGTVESVRMISDNNLSAAYVEMPEMSEAEMAISQLNETTNFNYDMQINRARCGPDDRRKHCRLGGRRNTDLIDA
ncbi:MAG: RNA-binding protein [Candidatus Cloacimonadales bacterium]|nr:RNA-binding protein [Candidatus Cloacimonadales bacterium]